mmetsp:Transcript_105206/g.234784  ORF Transcript_105206/g.234784 Transcript_105206/m.234784 type:complete len:200 (-) Transcript_105206:154-753(-)
MGALAASQSSLHSCCGSRVQGLRLRLRRPQQWAHSEPGAALRSGSRQVGVLGPHAHTPIRVRGRGQLWPHLCPWRRHTLREVPQERRALQSCPGALGEVAFPRAPPLRLCCGGSWRPHLRLRGAWQNRRSRRGGVLRPAARSIERRVVLAGGHAGAAEPLRSFHGGQQDLRLWRQLLRPGRAERRLLRPGYAGVEGGRQ